MKYVTWAIVPFCWLLTACSGQSTEEDKIKVYYDVQSLFSEQSNLLRNFAFIKKANIDGQSEEKTVSFDSLGWSKELAMFANMDINKGAYIGAYEIREDVTKTGKILVYERKPDAASEIDWVEVELDSEGLPLRFSGLFQEKNVLYQNKRKLSAEFVIENGRPLVSSYTIKGYQKILLKDTVRYQIESARVTKVF